jgi:hypothetical protein
MLGCVAIIADAAISLIGTLPDRGLPGDPLDRFTALRIEPAGQKAAVLYDLAPSSTPTRLVAVYVTEIRPPATGEIRYRDPGGAPVLLASVPAAEITLRANATGNLTAVLPSDVEREGDWTQKDRCRVSTRGARRVCWDPTRITVEAGRD